MGLTGGILWALVGAIGNCVLFFWAYFGPYRGGDSVGACGRDSATVGDFLCNGPFEVGEFTYSRALAVIYLRALAVLIVSPL